MKTRKHFIRKYELLARCIQTNLELFILQQFSIEELEKLKRAKNALRDLYGTISALENELKEI